MAKLHWHRSVARSRWQGLRPGMLGLVGTQASPGRRVGIVFAGSIPRAEVDRENRRETLGSHYAPWSRGVEASLWDGTGQLARLLSYSPDFCPHPGTLFLQPHDPIAALRRRRRSQSEHQG